MISILITGVNGYIGSKVAGNLLEKGYGIIGVDLISSNIDHLAKSLNFRFFRVDITDIPTFPDELKQVNVLIHCAALVHKRPKNLSKESYFRINYQGTKNILSFLNKKDLKQIIFLSTVSIYGGLTQEMIPDENTPPDPEDFYGESKLAAESEIREFSKINRIPFTILRLTPVYGETLLLNINKRVYLPKKIAFYKIASGKQLISLCSIHNVVDTVADCINDQKYFDEILILKDPEDYSAPEIICVLKEIFFEGHKPVLRIPRVIPETAFEILGLVMPARAKPYKYQFKKIAWDTVYSGAKMASLGIPLKWNLRNTLRVPEDCSD